jgi:hypothetical protein
LWLRGGDDNTKFFNQFDNYRKNLNTIWEIKNEEGRIVSSFEETIE